MTPRLAITPLTLTTAGAGSFSPSAVGPPEQLVPDAAEESLYERAREQTEDYLLRQWQRTGAAFEHVVAAVLEALGYTAQVTRASGDQGVDVIAHPDRLGLKHRYIKVQAKSGTGAVGATRVRQIRGTLHAGEKGIVVALGGFSREAEAVARTTPDLVLISGPDFVRIFLDVYDKLDARWQAQFPLKRVSVAGT